MHINFLKYLFLIALLLPGCAGKAFRFAAEPPVWRLDDQQPIPIPESTRYIRMDYYFEVLVRRAAIDVLQIAPSQRALDVNSLDHIPQSSWYTPRLGYRNLSPDELVRGPQKIGPPQLPVRVVRAKHLGSNPGFIIADQRDHLYLIKFDPPEFPGVETTTAQLVNRLFWGFGYHVPEDYLFTFRSTDMQVDSTADISAEEILLVFNAVAPPVDGAYCASASLLLDGIYLGPTADSGTRKDDANDLFRHEDRRSLRALRVFGAFTNQTDIRIDNSLDVYVGSPGRGYVRHYLLDFGEALGGHGAGHRRLWDGFKHIFSFREFGKNLLTLGLKKEAWEDLQYLPWKSVAAFESAAFDPADWKETYPYAPIQRALPDDNFWAARILAALTPEHIKALVAAAHYPEASAADYMVETLLQRRHKTIAWAYSLVSPLEVARFEGASMWLQDRALLDLPDTPPGDYLITGYDAAGKTVYSPAPVSARGGLLEIVLPSRLFNGPEGYLRLDVRVRRNGKPAPRAASFHLHNRAGGLQLSGVVH